MKKRTKNEQIRGIQKTLEAHRRFDYEYIPFIGGWKEPDKDFAYRQKGLEALFTCLIRTATFLFGRILTGVAFGARVTGKSNLRALKKQGAICIINHFNYLDTLFVRQAVGYYRSYHTMGPRNNKTGAGGWVIRHAGMLPFGSDLEAVRNLNAEIERLLKSGKIVNFYAEQALWTNYEKPRPLKDGAFHYAVKHGVPVLPIFCTFRRNGRGHIRKLRIRILPAVYADETLPRKERISAMKAAAEKAWKDCYEQTYALPLEYCTL